MDLSATEGEKDTSPLDATAPMNQTATQQPEDGTPDIIPAENPDSILTVEQMQVTSLISR